MLRHRREQERRTRLVVAVAALSCLVSVFPALASDPEAPRSNYIVTFKAEPLARTFDPASEEGAAARRRLDGIEARVRDAAGISVRNMGYRYRTTLAGFSARLTITEAGTLRRHRDVAAVVADGIRSAPQRRPTTDPLTTAQVTAEAEAPGTPRGGAVGPEPHAEPEDTGLAGQTPDLLDLPEGLWSRLGGTDHAGEDVIIGVVDTGIYPQHPSFADEPVTAGGTANYIGPGYGPPPPGWRGTCQPGENFPVTTCNNKLIGARYFVDGWGAANVAPQDFVSPRDADGHGTAMAGIAAGNYGVDPTYLGNDLGIGVISGIAPRARIAVYKALWAIPAFDGSGFGADSDLVAAIDAAVADGVDVLSLSIGAAIDLPPISNRSTMLDPVGLALLRAYEAGVVSVLAAGNEGPDPETIESPGQTPWAIAAGSSALSTTFAATATVSAGPGGPVIVATGISPTAAVPVVPLIDGRAAAAPGVDPGLAERCRPGALDPALVKGKAVLCRPGSAIFPSTVLSDLGAVAGVFYFSNLTNRYTVEDVWLPSIVVSNTDGVAIKELLASSPAATLTLTAGTATPTTTGDIVVNSSARGPTFGSPDILKPDLLAPGEEIIAPTSPDVPADARELFDFTQPGNLFRPIAGTSPSTAAVAGAAALLLDLHPDLDPGGVKSALMGTAVTEILEDDPVPSVPALVTGKGAGRIDPNRASDPGLIVTETAGRFREFVAGEDPAHDPARPVLEATDLNLPSIALDPLVGPRSTRRTFTSTDPEAATWQVSVEGLPGVSVEAEPARFSVDPGGSSTVEVRFDPGASPAGEPVEGALVLTHEQDGRTVRLPVVVSPQPLGVPEQANFGATTASGSAALAIPTGYDGPLSAQLFGFARPETRRDLTVGVGELLMFDLEVPAGSQALAAELGGAGLDAPLNELELAIFYDAAGDGFTAEDLLDSTDIGLSVLVPEPEPGAYRITVAGLSAPVVTFDLTTWLIADAVPDVLADRLPVSVGGTATLTLPWSGFDEPGTYLGLIVYDVPVSHPDGLPWETLVAITYG